MQTRVQIWSVPVREEGSLAVGSGGCVGVGVKAEVVLIGVLVSDIRAQTTWTHHTQVLST